MLRNLGGNALNHKQGHTPSNPKSLTKRSTLNVALILVQRYVRVELCLFLGFLEKLGNR